MESLRTTSSARRDAMSSPSVSMERGAYRTRAPPDRVLPPTFDISRPHDRRPSPGRISLCTALLVVVLTTATLSCFGAAYYLFTTRWDARVLHSVRTAQADGQIQVVQFELDVQAGDICPGEKFLTYLPHSGFHNQRIAFENALVLARLLNRTLLVPPVQLGNKPLHYFEYHTLSQFLAMSGKEDLQHCRQGALHKPVPLECLDYNEYTRVSWEWLVDLDQVKSQRLVNRWNMTDAWVHERFQIPMDDVLTLPDSDLYHYRFLDSPAGVSQSRDKYLESIHIPTLARSPERLLQLGTLFGSSRLRLKNPRNVLIRRGIRQSMAFAHPDLVRVADSIFQQLGGAYLGAHIRLGDGQFLKRRERNVRLIWWKLVHEVLKFSLNETLALERDMRAGEMNLRAPDFTVDLPSLKVPHPPLARLPETQRAQVPCRGQKHISTRLGLLNTPLFISTDLSDPLTDPSIAVILRTFPCAFFLSDFSALSTSLDRLQNGDDGVMLKTFLIPFLDAMVIGKAWGVVGTDGSTFSRFVEDVLWRRYHGFDIVQRG